VILAPANPQIYNPETYLFYSFMAITSAILLFRPSVGLSCQRPTRFGGAGT